MAEGAPTTACFTGVLPEVVDDDDDDEDAEENEDEVDKLLALVDPRCAPPRPSLPCSEPPHVMILPDMS